MCVSEPPQKNEKTYTLRSWWTDVFTISNVFFNDTCSKLELPVCLCSNSKQISKEVSKINNEWDH
jgi:hypothetical protein